MKLSLWNTTFQKYARRWGGGIKSFLLTIEAADYLICQIFSSILVAAPA